MHSQLPKLYLASTSPRRFELLSLLNISFETLKIEVPEVLNPNESPEDYVLRLSMDKASFGLNLTDGHIPVIGADTIGVLGDKILEKPRDRDEAIEMLKILSGKTHKVYTGLSVINDQRTISELVCTEVSFRTLSLKEIIDYVDTGDPLDKAGAYGIQGPAGAFISGIHGNYHNVVGLPLSHLCIHLKAFNIV